MREVRTFGGSLSSPLMMPSIALGGTRLSSALRYRSSSRSGTSLSTALTSREITLCEMNFAGGWKTDIALLSSITHPREEIPARTQRGQQEVVSYYSAYSAIVNPFT
jgi:hypothetical protein